MFAKLNGFFFRLLRDVMMRIPDVSMVIFGGSAWNGYHTFFLPNNRAFEKVVDKNLIDREVSSVTVFP